VTYQSFFEHVTVLRVVTPLIIPYHFTKCRYLILLQLLIQKYMVH